MDGVAKIQPVSTQLLEKFSSVQDGDGELQSQCFNLSIEGQPSMSKRTPRDIVFLIDVSGSMQSEATVQDAKGVTESHGLSYLDVVCHAAKVIVAQLQDQDFASLVTFASDATIKHTRMAMNAENRTKMTKTLSSLSPGGTTAMWEGLQTAMSTIDEAKRGDVVTSILLFTDGMPNEGSDVFTDGLREIKQSRGGCLPCTIDTFGFGYRMNSQLLQNISKSGQGNYAFIPDSGLIGTIFVHAFANLMTASKTQGTVSLKGADGTVHEFDVGTIYADQPFNKLLTVPLSFEPVDATVRFYDPASNSLKPMETSLMTSEEEGVDVSSLSDATKRSILVNQVVDIVEKRLMRTVSSSGAPAVQCALTAKMLPDLCDSIEAAADTMGLADDAPLEALLEDVQGQVTEALGNEKYFEKWGQHFMPSLIGAHRGSYCNNFKDPGVQFYGGELFRQLRDQADDVFVKLPPPKANTRGIGRVGRVTCASMASYHCRGGGCFTADSVVQMADGTSKKVKDIEPGDLVAVPQTDDNYDCEGEAEGALFSVAQVKTVVEIEAATQQMAIVQLSDDLGITPYHPIFYQGEWVFPVSLGTPHVVPCERVFDFVLDCSHSMSIGGFSCVTLGHGKTSNSVIKHPFFGTEVVINALKQCPSYAQGRVVLSTSNFVRLDEGDQAEVAVEAPLLSRAVEGSKPPGLMSSIRLPVPSLTS